jgi:type II secretory pathway pseudopilin PulG
VIAIMAILAAILFPVFAQAKEAAKKTQSLNAIKQTSATVAVSTTDSDDLLAMAHTTRWAAQTEAWNVVTPVPYNWKMASGAI